MSGRDEIPEKLKKGKSILEKMFAQEKLWEEAISIKIFQNMRGMLQIHGRDTSLEGLLNTETEAVRVEEGEEIPITQNGFRNRRRTGRRETITNINTDWIIRPVEHGLHVRERRETIFEE